MTLYHYTSWSKARSIEAGGGILVPGPTRVVWATDLDFPNRQALALPDPAETGEDHGEIRYEILDEELFVQWVHARAFLRPEAAAALEPEGSLIAHWWASAKPVRAVLDPYPTAVV